MREGERDVRAREHYHTEHGNDHVRREVVLVAEDVVNGWQDCDQHDTHERVLDEAENAVEQWREAPRRERQVQPVDERVQLVAEHEPEQRKHHEAEDRALGGRTRLAERREVGVRHKHRWHPQQPQLAVCFHLIIVTVFFCRRQVLNAEEHNEERDCREDRQISERSRRSKPMHEEATAQETDTDTKINQSLQNGDASRAD